jgi:tRNA threonylcarbamoyladenosine biosynthesis protein TsaB
MWLLAIDTATNAGGLALARNGEAVGVVMSKTPSRYSEQLIAWAHFLLNQNRIGIEDVNVFAVCNGPGSFTGLRIGLATAKAFGQALGRPVVAVSSLEALASRFRWAHRRLAVMLDARRRQVYAARYLAGEDGEMRLQGSEEAALPSEWLASCPVEQGAFVGDGAVLYRDQIAALHPQATVIDSDNCILAELCRLGYSRFVRGETATAGSVRANYLRLPDAKVGAAGVVA